ncbi:hypothetical protein J41TS12_50500 [Paenibacillus antibioticophila]|uniref:Uncharacterized protein n=1 Tax=Paenibacillus antibioticophila TaxID=1274374 RepID=A0A919XWB3_9BACL|nr:hypothetical protein J41TS12_50500 [Paenibacillus antibioticophila]
MAKIPDRIDNDDEFNELCGRMVKCAQLIEDPLSTPSEVATYNAAYDRMWRVCEDYRLRASGVSFYPGELTEPPKAVPVAPSQPPPPEPKQDPPKPKPSASAWLDD